MDQERWEKDMGNGVTRYYTVSLVRDLFGMIVLSEWGSLGSSRGGKKSQPVTSADEAKKLFEQIGKRRMQRGYQKVN